MLVTKCSPLGNKRVSATSIEKQFERTRVNYLKDLNKLRRKYESTLADLTLQYNDACALQK